VRKSSSKRGLSAKLSAEAKRFTAYSRRRRAITITVVSAFSSLLLIVLATVVTPVLAVEKITISGTDRIKQESVQKALKSQIGKPLPTVNSAEIASLLEKFPLIESFAIVSLPPHGLKIQITERQPIVIIESGGVKYLYDPAGVRVGKATSKDKYPEMAIAGLPENSKNFAAAIDVLMALPASLLERLASIDAKSKDDVTMRLRGYSGQRIIWGDGSNSVLKSKVLAALIKNQKKNDMVTFDVSSPNAPAVRYGNF
jgi:cell division protein FtsQ